MKDKKIVEILRRGGITVIPTDTIYGLVGSAFSKKAIERIYKIKGRKKTKPFIILISSFNDLKRFNIKPSVKELKILKKIWPAPVSIILPCPSKKFSYLHRGTKNLAFRLPKKKSLIAILKKSGPLVAPSANPEGCKPAQTVKEAKKYFGDKIDFYVNSGHLAGRPSKLVSIENGIIKLLR